MANIYEKLANARADFKAAGVKQSGNNKFAGYTYFELADILPKTTELEKKYKMLSVVSYGAELATLRIYNAEEPKEVIEFTSPMSTADLKGCHAVQNLGAVETYVRRYLYLAAYEIVETEALDRTHGDPDKTPEKREQSRQSPQRQEQRQAPEMTVEQASNYCMKNGKHANKPFSQVPRDYLEWVAKNLNGVAQTAAEVILRVMDEQQKQADREYLQAALDDDIPF